MVAEQLKKGNMFPLHLVIECLSKAIATQEGFYSNKSIPAISQRLKNPGNLTHWRNKKGQAYPTNNGYVNFPNPEEGFAALRGQIKINLKKNPTFKEFFTGVRGSFAGFAPRGHGDNDPVGYAAFTVRFLSRNLGLAEPLSIDDKISKLVAHSLFQEAALAP